MVCTFNVTQTALPYLTLNRIEMVIGFFCSVSALIITLLSQ